VAGVSITVARRLDSPTPLDQDWRTWPPLAKAKLLKELERAAGEDKTAGRRDLAQRRAFAGDPARYIREVLGLTLSPQQEEALVLFEKHDRVLVPSGNNVGKTFLLAAYGVYRMDAVAALPSQERDYKEQGAQVLLPGPDASTIFATVYQAMLEHAARAESRGFAMPGIRSERSVLWYVRPHWFVEAFSPPRVVDQDVRHTASGRHHANQVALFEEGNGADEPTWRAVEGMCSSAGNKILSAYNPSEDAGPAAARERAGSYVALHLSALDHPNVVERRPVIDAAVGHLVVDARVRDECRDLGSWPERQPDTNEGDFLYALPPLHLPERGGRGDGVRGHPDAPVRCFRPGGFFDPQVRGMYPRSSLSTLCDPAAWDAAVARFKVTREPRLANGASAPPDRVGLDPAREGNDNPTAVPAWGEEAETLLRRAAQLALEGRGPESLARARCGTPVVLKKGDGVDLARQVADRWPRSPVNCDEGGGGTSCLDHAVRVMKRDWLGVSFGARPKWMDNPLPGEPWCENIRTLMYVRAGRLVNAGLVDVHEDAELRAEFLAHWLELRWRIVETIDQKRGIIKERKPSMLLCAKDDLKKKIGRSPDKADALVLSLHGGGRPVYAYQAAESERAVVTDDFPTHDDDFGEGAGGGRKFGRGAW